MNSCFNCVICEKTAEYPYLTKCDDRSLLCGKCCKEMPIPKKCPSCKNIVEIEPAGPWFNQQIGNISKMC
jgi:hypothetical protein